MNKITEKLLEVITDWKGAFSGAFNIREDGECVSRQSSPNVSIEPMAGAWAPKFTFPPKRRAKPFTFLPV